jgi:hypothetical protein
LTYKHGKHLCFEIRQILHLLVVLQHSAVNVSCPLDEALYRKEFKFLQNILEQQRSNLVDITTQNTKITNDLQQVIAPGKVDMASLSKVKEARCIPLCLQF